jgi:hypothetical protein
MRLVKVSAWELTDDDVAAECSTTEPDYAAELRRLKAWRRAPPQTDDLGRAYLVLR